MERKTSMKRLLSLILIISILFSTVSMGYATDDGLTGLNSDVEEIVAAYAKAFNDPTLFESEYAMGQEIPVYKLENGVFTIFDENRYIPIYKDDEIWAMITIVDANTDYSNYTVDQDYVDELRSASKNGEQSTCLIFDFLTVYAYSTDQVSNLITYDLTPTENVPSRAKKIKSTTNIEDLIQSSDMDFNQIVVKELTPLNVPSGALNPQSVNFEYNPNEEIEYYINITPYKQPEGSQICWAVATFCIAQEFLWPTAPIPCPYPKDPMEIVNYRNAHFLKPSDPPNKQAGKINDAQNCLRDMYYIYTDFYERPLTEREIHTCLEEDCAPMYSAWYNDEWDYGHSVCLLGYGIAPPNHYIMIMESLTGKYKMIVLNDYGDYRMTASTIKVKWCHSLAVTDSP